MLQADDISASYCKITFGMILSAPEDVTPGEGSSRYESFALALFDSIKGGCMCSPASCSDLVLSLGEETGSQVCNINACPYL
jgi:hypothetical protein